ncbi:unnamed protein product [Lactuca saligna]|uniref:Cytochrome P450 n=1 Tax=Lactuca saligna TaxID=75948 RepID=A0AA35YA65_LACSI|nr:unnamed protein product [Lactuca saligna]
MISFTMSSWLEVISMKIELTFTVITLLAISFAVLLHKSRKTTSRLPPGPCGLPLLGYLPFLGPNLHLEFTKMAKRFGPIFKLQLGSKTYIIVNSSDLAKVVVNEHDDIFANRDPPVAALILSYGGKDITWSDNNPYWRNMRKVFVHEVLSNKNLEASGSFRRAGVRKTIKHVYERMGTEVDFGGIAFSTSLTVISSMVWGKSVDEEEESSDNLWDGFREVMSGVMDIVGEANVSDFFPVLTRFDLQGVQRKMKLQFEKFDAILQRIIDERMSIKPQESTEQHGRKDFVQILLELKQQNTESSFSLTQIKAFLVDFFIAGTDTTTVMAEWTMTEVLKHSDVMKKIQEELERVVGEHNIVEESHLPKLCYLDAVIKETFRLHPALPLLVVRSPSKSCTVDGYKVPKGSNVYLNVWAIHRDPQYWENPLEFDPNRFLNLDGTTKFNYNGLNTNFLAFGSGRRRCPGLPLGEKMLMYLLASLLHSFNWTLPDEKEHELPDKFGVVLKKGNPLIAIPSQRFARNNLYM